MLDLGFFFLVQNIFILTLVFWLLSFLGRLFFKVKVYKSSTEVFECGFLTTHTLNLQFNYNFFVTAILLVLYDLEFLFLLPFIFNISVITFSHALLFGLFLSLILLSFVYDWEMISLNWTV